MKKILAAALMLTLPTAALADPSKFEVGIGASLLGQTFEAGYRFNDKFGVRAMHGNSNFGVTDELEGNEYDLDLKLAGSGVFMDYYPTGGALRVSAGALKLDHVFTGTTSGTVSLNENTYTGSLEAEGSFVKDYAPAVTVGFSKSFLQTALHLNMDVGAVYTGGINFDAKDPSGTIPQSEIDNHIADVRNDLGDLKVAPFFKVGVSILF